MIGATTLLVKRLQPVRALSWATGDLDNVRRSQDYLSGYSFQVPAQHTGDPIKVLLSACNRKSRLLDNFETTWSLPEDLINWGHICRHS
jgi:hypothetical protein